MKLTTPGKDDMTTCCLLGGAEVNMNSDTYQSLAGIWYPGRLAADINSDGMRENYVKARASLLLAEFGSDYPARAKLVADRLIEYGEYLRELHGSNARRAAAKDVADMEFDQMLEDLEDEEEDKDEGVYDEEARLDMAGRVADARAAL